MHVTPSQRSELFLESTRVHAMCQTLSVNMVAGLRLFAAQCAVVQSTTNVRIRTSCVIPPVSLRRVPDPWLVWGPDHVSESGDDACHKTVDNFPTVVEKNATAPRGDATKEKDRETRLGGGPLLLAHVSFNRSARPPMMHTNERA